MSKTPERREIIQATCIGNLGDFGLGNPDGIRGRRLLDSNEERTCYAQELINSLAPVTDPYHDACIDGRHTLGQADGSAPEVRERHVGASANDLELALNSESDIVTEDLLQRPLNEVIEHVSAVITERTQKRRAAHTGSCGGANGAVQDNEAIAEYSPIMESTDSLMSNPVVMAFFKTGYDEMLASRVQENAKRTAAYLRENAWQGQAYVEGVLREDPSAVERLEVDAGAHGGHKENAIAIDLVEGRSVTLDDVFVIDGSAIMKKARGLAGTRGDTGYTQAVVADIAKHLATAHRLASRETPVFLLSA